MTCTKQCRVVLLVSRRGGIGRRARFRSVFREEWGFDSLRRYHLKNSGCHKDSKILEIFCGYGITAVHQPSKLDIRVRLPLPAPVAKTQKIRSQKNYGWILERSKRADCKSASDAFGGSNPPPATILNFKRVLQNSKFCNTFLYCFSVKKLPAEPVCRRNSFSLKMTKSLIKCEHLMTLNNVSCNYEFVMYYCICSCRTVVASGK